MPFPALPTGNGTPVERGTPSARSSFPHVHFPIKLFLRETADSGAGQGKYSLSLEHFIVLESQEVLKNTNKTSNR